jgi:Ca2+-binding RTX toxin-like protein
MLTKDTALAFEVLAGVLAAGLVAGLSLAPVTAEAAAAAPRCQGRTATIIGTPGDDVLTGTQRADVIAGLDGRDTILGRGGDDIICAGDNPDLPSEDSEVTEYVDGGSGDDKLYGGPGGDELISGRGDDLLYGGPGRDFFVGVNRDTDANHAGFDQMYGGPDDDVLRAWTSRVVMHGGGGDDLLVGDNGADRLFGDAGDDDIAPDGGSDHVSGGPGIDIVNYTMLHAYASASSHTIAVTVNLANGVATGKRFGTDRLRGDVEGAHTGDGDDTLTGDAKSNIFDGGDGDRSTVDGRGGRDLLRFDEPVTLDLATGKGRMRSAYGGNLRLRVQNVEDVQGSPGTDIILGNDRANRLTGGTYDDAEFGDGNDYLDGRGGNDTLGGSGADDDLRGGEGDDVLAGGHGDDRLDGGAGQNQLDGGPGTDVCLNPSTGSACE